MPREKHDIRVVTVYALASTKDYRVRYVGQTVNPAARLQQHFQHSARYPNRYISRWIKSVQRDGFNVVMEVLEENAVWNETERQWIAACRANGFKLVNCTDGGEGCLGLIWSDEQRQRQSQVMKGVPKSAQHRAAMSKARKGVPLAPGVSEKVSAALKGRRPSNLADLHKRRKGRPVPAAQRIAIAASLKGRRVTNIEALLANLEKARAARGPVSAESRKKMSESHLGRPSLMTPEQRAAAGGRAKVLMQDPITRAKVSAALTGRSLSQDAIEKRTASRRASGGYSVSEATKQKQSESAKAGWEKRRQRKKIKHVE